LQVPLLLGLRILHRQLEPIGGLWNSLSLHLFFDRQLKPFGCLHGCCTGISSHSLTISQPQLQPIRSLYQLDGTINGTTNTAGHNPNEENNPVHLSQEKQ
jgi:hypothetical protein